ncbi:MAG: hypothetical protein HZA91_04390 [Verrucomicrobia bacterium]|nr:hypothetical protein [Verrucomicrobiota bacterium]
MKRLLKWLVRLGILLGLLAVAGGYWLAEYDARNWALWFHQNKGMLTDATWVSSISEGAVVVQEMDFANDRGLHVRGRVSMPEPQPNVRWPAVVLVVGVETGRRVLDLIPPQRGLVVVALDYPGEPKLDFNGLVPATRSAIRLRNACVNMVSGVMLIADWLQRQPLVHHDHISVVGVSVGAMVAAAAGGVDSRFSKVVLVQGGEGVGRIVAHNAVRLGLPFSPESCGKIGNWLFKPLEPARYVGRIAPRQLTVLAAKEDAFMPADATEALYSRASEPKQMVWMEGPHVTADEKTVIAEAAKRVFTELAKAAPAGPPKKMDAMGR